MSYVGWMIFGVVLLVVEILTPTFFFLWFSIAAFLSGILAMFGLNLGWQVSVFAVSSTFLVIFTRPIAKKLMGESSRKVYVDELKKSVARVVQDIDADKGTGIVKISGESWRAVSVDPKKVIKKGEEVLVERIEGTTVYVKPIETKAEKEGEKA
ncbi:membrane protease regulatory membrane protein [Kosmotoga arenicorallina S304]|uniref:Membrane protease regulatory membrane protein n=1 Tax=Kosmotoga arenicorallina S304 TaxID=1453497 RepID=A0A176K0I6_9BACT|nr:NfeD family protein [Kosmotoga arenicorallina]OAA30133.1 membrane protease regulatory membrane protein [Kosmotoga arenicorallina S304]